MKTIIGIFIGLILLIVGYFVGLNIIKNWDYKGQSNETVQVKIDKGSGISAIGEELKKADVIAAVKPFVKVASGEKISYGTFQLNKKQSSASALAQLLDPKSRIDSIITIPEGRSVYQTIGLIATAVPELTRPILQDSLNSLVDKLPDSAKGNFEGWLYPDTYNFEFGADPKTIFEKMIDKTYSTLKELDADEKDYQTIITKASIIQKETSKKDDMLKVSAVINNRLKQGMVLGMDTIIAYGVTKGEYDAGLELKQSDLDDEKAPYNARKKQGLPPTPISSPGKDAIDAAIHPADGKWLYFVTTNPDTQETKFAETEAEFNKYRDEYKTWLNNNKK